MLGGGPLYPRKILSTTQLYPLYPPLYPLYPHFGPNSIHAKLYPLYPLYPHYPHFRPQIVFIAESEVGGRINVDKMDRVGPLNADMWIEWIESAPFTVVRSR